MTKAELLQELAKNVIAQEPGFWCFNNTIGIIFETNNVDYCWLIELAVPSQRKIDYELAAPILWCEHYNMNKRSDCKKIYKKICGR